jgi:probable FeS assembly SUF system protein SufT
MDKTDWLSVTRDCQAIQVPYGTLLTLRQNTRVRIRQNLGDTATVQTEQGYLLRISSEDLDSIGLTPKPLWQPQHEGQIPTEADIWEILRSVYDPEIAASIVDLGLIYSCKISPDLDCEDRIFIDIQMTLTAPGCGMGQVMKDEVEHKLARLPGVSRVQVQLTFTPPWDPSRMSESARLQLGMM